MAARVEVTIGERFNVLNRIRWVKDAGWHNKTDEATLRSWLSPWEEVIFAEHYGADNIAKGEAGYAAKCDEVRGFVFEPLRAYLDGERQRAGVSGQQIMDYFAANGWPKYVTARHAFSASQWDLPTAENYQRLRQCFHDLNHGGEYLRRDYEYLRRDYEDLRRDYEDLRRDYEDLRRPFQVTADVPYTDVWTFKTVNAYPGKHVCEKPMALMEHIVKASSRPGGVVLDCFCGSGSTGVAAQRLGRDFIGIEIDPKWTARARERIEAAAAQGRLALELEA
jgi:site-specific DNA-methyltransferase (adenine-specific)